MSTVGYASSPLRIPKNKKGDLWSLNLNNLNNTHFQTYNKLKQEYTALMKPQIELMPFFDEPVSIKLTVYPSTKRLFDIDNVCGVVAKMFLDALVASGKLEDDNYKWVPEIIFRFGDVDRGNPRCEIVVNHI